LWSFVNEKVPEDGVVAYSNQFMIYPMYGFENRRRLVYAPVRRGESIAALIFSDPVPDGKIPEMATAAADADGDEKVWRGNLAAAGARYLVIGAGFNPPEIGWAGADPTGFKLLYRNGAGAGYGIVGDVAK
jgi:hypothetical protein